MWKLNFIDFLRRNCLWHSILSRNIVKSCIEPWYHSEQYTTCPLGAWTNSFLITCFLYLPKVNYRFTWIETPTCSWAVLRCINFLGRTINYSSRIIKTREIQIHSKLIAFLQIRAVGTQQCWSRCFNYFHNCRFHCLGSFAKSNSHHVECRVMCQPMNSNKKCIFCRESRFLPSIWSRCFKNRLYLSIQALKLRNRESNHRDKKLSVGSISWEYWILKFSSFWLANLGEAVIFVKTYAWHTRSSWNPHLPTINKIKWRITRRAV